MGSLIVHFFAVQQNGMVLMFPELVPVVGCLSFAILFKKWQHPFFAALLFVLDDGVDDMHGGETLERS